MKHPYALDENGKLTHISVLKRNKETGELVGAYRGKRFYNFEDENHQSQELIPVIGEKREPHFRIKNEGEAPLFNEETYWHKTGKKLFEELYRESLENEEIPFYIPYEEFHVCDRLKEEHGIECDYGMTIQKLDVSKRLTNIEVEHYDWRFKPDIKISNPKNPNEKIWIEIAHSSKVKEKKARAGVKIIEIHIHDELDLESIRALKEGVLRNNVQYHNFKINTITKAHCKVGGCKKEFIQFFVTQSQKAKMEMKPEHLLTPLNRKFIIWHKKELKSKYGQFRTDDVFRYLLGEAALNKIPVKSCYLCQSHRLMRRNKQGNNIYCQQKSMTCQSNEAGDCDIFLLDYNHVTDYVTQFDTMEGYQEMVTNREYYQRPLFQPKVQAEEEEVNIEEVLNDIETTARKAIKGIGNLLKRWLG